MCRTKGDLRQWARPICWPNSLLGWHVALRTKSFPRSASALATAKLNTSMNANLLRLRVCKLLLKFTNPLVHLHQGFLYYNLMLLYLLDKRRCLSVLRDLNESSKQLADIGNSLKCRHNGNEFKIPTAENGPSWPVRPHA